jgi:hypothetical protein
MRSSSLTAVSVPWIPTNRRSRMSESGSLPTEPGAVFVARDGRSITDPAEIAAELERDLSLGLPLEAKAGHVCVAGDIAHAPRRGRTPAVL